MPDIFVTPRRGFALIGFFAIALVLVAIVLTKVLQLEPCPLCVFQRLLYLGIGGFALAAVIWPRTLLITGSLSLLSSLGGLVTAGYQSWMQAFPASFVACSVGVPTTPIEKLVDWLGELWPLMFYAWGDCTNREWTFFGLSMANWSAVMFLVIGMLSITLLMRTRTRREMSRAVQEKP